MSDSDRRKPKAAQELLDLLNEDGLDLETEAAYHRAYFEQRMREQFLWEQRDKKSNS